MLLRRITKHVSDQNWFAVFLDFLIVVVGILIAFQITNWNEWQGEIEKQQLIHTRLQSDFKIIQGNLKKGTSAHANVVEALETLRIVLERGSALPEEDAVIKLALRNGFQYWQISHRSGTFIELLSSGQLNLVPNEELRIALLRYDRRAQQARFNLVQLRDSLHPDMSKFTQYRKIGRLTRNDHERIILSPIAEYDIEAMAADEEFRRVVDQMFEMQTWIQVNMNNTLRKELDTVVELLNRSYK